MHKTHHSPITGPLDVSFVSCWPVRRSCLPVADGKDTSENEITIAVREAGACGARVLLGDREYQVCAGRRCGVTGTKNRRRGEGISRHVCSEIGAKRSQPDRSADARNVRERSFRILGQGLGACAPCFFFFFQTWCPSVANKLVSSRRASFP